MRDNSADVTVHALFSSQLIVDQHLPRRADLLVHELFSSNLVSEGMLEKLNDARENLLAADGRVVPATATLIGQLVEGAAVFDRVLEGPAAGMRSGTRQPHFLRLTEEGYPNEEIRALSAPFDLLRFDFRRTLALADQTTAGPHKGHCREFDGAREI